MFCFDQGIHLKDTFGNVGKLLDDGYMMNEEHINPELREFLSLSCDLRHFRQTLV